MLKYHHFIKKALNMNIENSNPQILQNASFEFRGNALDFFKIWFVNLVLTIITLGIYGAWAKVRNNQYMHGNTYLGGHSFEYTANPIRILIGRIIVLVCYLSFFITSQFGFFYVAGVIIALFMLMLPFLLRQALVFKAKYTRFHGLGFRYKASVGQFYVFFISHTLLNLITFFIILPYTHNQFKKLIINNTYYGDTQLYFKGKPSEFFFTYYVRTMLLYFAMGVVTAMVLATAWLLTDTIGSGEDGVMGVAIILLALLLYPMLFGAQGAYEAWIGRAVYNNTSIREHNMINEWSALDLAWIRLSNFVAIVFSLGLLYPWTYIRAAKYKLENTGFESLNLNTFEGQIEQDRSAIGEETADFFDFDIGF
jgi:uncharacterized membrane protein YjgN (DUF898 family)